MEVKISFDTDKDTIEDFKKLEDYIQKIIKEKGGQAEVTKTEQVKPESLTASKIEAPKVEAPVEASKPPVSTVTSQPLQQPQLRTPPPAQPQLRTPESKPQLQQPQKTSGGCRVMEYKDMSQEMSDIFSGKKKRGL